MSLLYQFAFEYVTVEDKQVGGYNNNNNNNFIHSCR